MVAEGSSRVFGCVRVQSTYVPALNTLRAYGVRRGSGSLGELRSANEAGARLGFIVGTQALPNARSSIFIPRTYNSSQPKHEQMIPLFSGLAPTLSSLPRGSNSLQLQGAEDRITQDQRYFAVVPLSS